jgi:aryl-phospho-beta-D-glucosidase BglC (GH1 family)
MKVKFLRATIIGTAVILIVSVFMVSLYAAPDGPEWSVDEDGNITVDGEIFHVKGGSWFGLEGRHEPSDDPDNPSGAPMELYIGNVFWASTDRTHDSDIAEFQEMGFNTVRIPIAPQTLDPDDPQAQEEYKKNAEEVSYVTSYDELVAVIQKCDAAGMYVILDMHSCSNYVGWRAGRFDARPPYVDNTREQYDFMREDCSCAATDNPDGVEIIQAYDESAWLDDLATVAGLSEELGVDNIMGIDIFNEPWDYTWDEWKGYIEDAYDTISEVDPNILIFAQGIGSTSGNQDGSPESTTDTPHGDVDTNPNWGENFYEAGDNPPDIPKEKLVFSPHTYGPSVFVQRMFMDPDQPECEGLEEEEAAANECNIVIDPELLEQGWEEHFGYLKDLGYAVVIGEWGGNSTWPEGAELRKQDMFGYLEDTTVDWQWQQAFANYLIKKGITDNIYWSINPESGDTGGVYEHAYDPVSNTAGWGTWTGVDQDKLGLLQSIWDAADSGSGTTDEPTDEPTDDPSDDPTSDVTATTTVVNEWGTGGQLTITVTNNGSTATDGWSVEVDIPGTITNIWSGVGSGSGTVTISNADWNGVIPAGGSVEVGVIYSN